MNIKIAYAIAGAVIGFIPGGSVLLLILEFVMFYHICKLHDTTMTHEGIGFIAAITGVEFLFKAAAELIHALPIIGQFANSIVAGSVVYALGYLVENHIKERKK